MWLMYAVLLASALVLGSSTGVFDPVARVEENRAAWAHSHAQAAADLYVAALDYATAYPTEMGPKSADAIAVSNAPWLPAGLPFGVYLNSTAVYVYPLQTRPQPPPGFAAALVTRAGSSVGRKRAGNLEIVQQPGQTLPLDSSVPASDGDIVLYGTR